MNSAPNPLSGQSELPIEIPPSAPPQRKLDPRRKPTWEEWKDFDVWRRLLNDCRLRGKPWAYVLYQWLNNCKETTWQASGQRVDAKFIAKKFGMKRDTVYAMTKLLQACGYLTWSVGQGCVHVYRVLKGERSVQQTELPFLIPMKSAEGSRCPPKGTPEQSGCPLKGTAGVAIGAPGCPPKGTLPYMCEISVKGECDSPPDSEPLWKLDNDLRRIRDAIKDAYAKYSDGPERQALLLGLRKQEKDLERRRAGIDPNAAFEEAQASKSNPSPSYPAAQPMTPERIAEIKRQAGLL